MGAVPAVRIACEIPFIIGCVITAIHTSLRFTGILNYCMERLLVLV